MSLRNCFRSILKCLIHEPFACFIWCIIFATSAVSEDCSVNQIDLRGNFGQVRFEVVVADTQKSRAQGLMNVSNLGQRNGMLFVYTVPQSVSFWMKNTLVPLDMLFADGTGEIVQIHYTARPHDETPIFGGNNVQFVLEINAGLSKQHDIHIGSQMRHPMITDKAGWACE